jgi:hypothetical protein
MADRRKVSTAIVAESEEKSYVFKVRGYSRAKELLKMGDCVVWLLDVYALLFL